MPAEQNFNREDLPVAKLCFAMATMTMIDMHGSTSQLLANNVNPIRTLIVNLEGQKKYPNLKFKAFHRGGIVDTEAPCSMHARNEEAP